MRVLKALLQIAVVSSSLLSLRPGLAQEQAAAPIFQEGDTWQFKYTDRGFQGPSSVSVRTYEIVYANGDFEAYAFGAAGKQTVESNTRRDFLLSLLGKGEGESQNAYLQFPLFVGKEWRIEYKIGRRRLMAGRAGVIKMEDVDTPVGSFRAFKIERQENGGVSFADWKWFFTSTYHYSQETRSIVKLHWETSGDINLQVRDVELIGFSPKTTLRQTKP
jgi:hypothetical protein